LRFCCLYFCWACTDQVRPKTLQKGTIFTRARNKAAPDILNFYLVAEIKPTSFPGSGLYNLSREGTVFSGQSAMSGEYPCLHSAHRSKHASSQLPKAFPRNTRMPRHGAKAYKVTKVQLFFRVVQLSLPSSHVSRHKLLKTRSDPPSSTTSFPASGRHPPRLGV
jgi:hypothetical protein